MEKSCGRFFFSWPEAYQAGVEVVGGKGWNLSRLEQYCFSIPAGGVLAAGAYRDFIEENNLRDVTENILQSVTIDNIGDKGVEEKLFLIRDKIKAGHISPHIQEEVISGLKNTEILKKPLAVRSSATAEDAFDASFAGIHESFLNVRGLDNILTAVKGCYASLWTPRAIAYRRRMNVKDDQVMPAVVILEMVVAEAAGIGFTCDPRTGRQDVLVISANFGLGESVVGGVVEPDEYTLNDNFKLAEKKIGRKEGMTVISKNGGTEFIKTNNVPGQVLSGDNIQKLGMLLLRVFETLGRSEQHQDIEWVFDGENFYLVQARPVTALPIYTFPELKGQQEFWSNANFRDAMPMVQSMLNWSFLRQNINSLFNVPFEAIGYPIPPGLSHIRLYQGRLYLNPSIHQWLFYDAFGIAPREINEAVGGHQQEIKINKENPFWGIKGLKRLGRLFKLAFIGHKFRRNAKKSFDKVDCFTKDLLRENIKGMSSKDLVDKINQIKSVVREFGPVFMFCNFDSVMSPLEKALDKYFPGKGKATASALMVGSANITSAQHGYRLMEIAEVARGDTAAHRFFSTDNFRPLLWERELPEKSQFKASFQSFLTEYGHRGVYEGDIINPRWREDPSYLLHIIKGTMETADLGKIKTLQKEKTDEAWEKVKQRLPFYRRGLINYLLRFALKSAERREMAKSMFAKTIEPLRLIFQEIGRRFTERGLLTEPTDIYHCAWHEILSILQGDWNGRVLKMLVAERKHRRKEMEALSPPDLIIGDVPKFVEPMPLTSSNAISGVGVAAGNASGQARLIYHPNEGEKLRGGDVLVTPSTDPGWTPLFLRACAIVMETGGFMSHGAIVAREYGIPAVVNIPGVMKLIKNGQIISVNGDEGKVYLTANRRNGHSNKQFGDR